MVMLVRTIPRPAPAFRPPALNGDNNFSSRRGGPHTGRICKVRRVKTEISVLHTRLLPVTGHLGTANWRRQNRGCRHLCATKLPSSRHLCKCSSPPAAHSSSHLASPSASKTPQASALQFRRCYHAEDYGGRECCGATTSSRECREHQTCGAHHDEVNGQAENIQHHYSECPGEMGRIISAAEKLDYRQRPICQQCAPYLQSLCSLFGNSLHPLLNTILHSMYSLIFSCDRSFCFSLK